jgi:hypothetical protein
MALDRSKSLALFTIVFNNFQDIFELQGLLYHGTMDITSRSSFNNIFEGGLVLTPGLSFYSLVTRLRIFLANSAHIILLALLTTVM